LEILNNRVMRVFARHSRVPGSALVNLKFKLFEKKSRKLLQAAPIIAHNTRWLLVVRPKVPGIPIRRVEQRSWWALLICLLKRCHPPDHSTPEGHGMASRASCHLAPGINCVF
jgi:hypothetical protein